jgi:nitrite reductase/ring-hydroxylating ferredoxin subunit
MAELTRVAGTEDIKPGTGLVVEAGGKYLAVFNVDGTFYAIDNECVHRGGPLGEGELRGTVVECPWHGWTYDVTTGRCTSNPTACVKSYRVTIDGPDVKVQL